MNDTKLCTSQFKHLKFEVIDSQYIVSLIDTSGYKIIKGYGNTAVDAINDLHSLLL